MCNMETGMYIPVQDLQLEALVSPSWSLHVPGLHDIGSLTESGQ